MAKHIKDLMPVLLPTNGWKAQLLQNWGSVIGDLHMHVRLEKINDHSLVLGVFNSSWMQELYLLSPILIEKINSHLDQPRIKQLRFKIASKYPTKKKKVTYKKRLPEKEVILSSREQQALTKIDDKQLGQAMKNFLIRCYREK